MKAGDIVAYREEFGPSRTVEQIMEVRGIGLATHKTIKNMVYVGPASP